MASAGAITTSAVSAPRRRSSRRRGPRLSLKARRSAEAPFLVGRGSEGPDRLNRARDQAALGSETSNENPREIASPPTAPRVLFFSRMLKKTFWPPINTDERRSEDRSDVVFNRRLSAFIGGQIYLELFQQPASSGTGPSQPSPSLGTPRGRAATGSVVSLEFRSSSEEAA